MPPVLSVITPVYNEARNLETNIHRIQKALDPTQLPYEIIIVEDSSPDGSGAIADQLAAEDPEIKVLHRPQKRGLGTALKDAFPLTGGDYVACMDCDLSHDPRYLVDMLKAAGGADIVIGSRFVEGGSIIGRSRYRDFLSVFANTMIRLFTGTSIGDWTSGLRIYRRSVWLNIMPYVNCNKWDFQFESLYKSLNAGCTVREVPITFYERADGESKFTVREILQFAGSFLKVRFLEPN